MAPLPPIVEYPEAQQDQVNVLESIYGDNFRRVQGQKSAWQTRHNLAFELRVDALNDKDISVSLQIDLPPEWPKVAPSIKLKEADDVRPHVRERIRSVLKTVKPDIDIYAICDSLQEVMEDAAESKVRRKTMPALDEERAKMEADAQRKAEEEKQRRTKEEQERQAQESATMAKKVEGLQLRQKRATGTTESDDEDQTQHLELPNPVTQFDETMSITDKNDDLTYFRDVWGTYVILKTKEKKVTVVMPVVENQVTARRLLLKQIRLDAGIVSRPAQLLEEVREVERLLADLKLRRHDSVVDVFGYKVVVNHAPTDQDKIISIDLTILSAFANKGSLAETLDIYDTLAGSRIMSWTTQLLEALAFFDDLGYAHPAVHIHNILLFRTPDGRISVQLSDGYGTDLRDLVMQTRSAKGIKEPTISAGWRAPELNQATPARSEKTCIWDLGVVIMQMISGKEVLNNYTSPSDYVSSNNLTDELYEMLCRMTALDQSARPKAYDLTSASFLRGDGSLFMAQPLTGQVAPYFAGRRGSAIKQESSWKTMWEEHGVLGKGGFGEVVKARNRIDLSFYAVKRVRCESDDDIGEILREIKLLSSLNSSRIVRYFNSWIERDVLPNSDSEESSDYVSQSIPQIRSTGHRWAHDPDFLSGPDDGIEFGRTPDESDAEQEGFFYQPGESDLDTDGGTGAANLDAEPGQPQHVERPAPKPAGPQTLYIVMELCETQSLRGIIRSGKLNKEAEIWRLFGQIVEGLAYIHGKGLIHRDLKPENIFLDERNDIRIGDFGLATRGKIASIAGRPAMNQATEESRSLGTSLYVAPELRSAGDGVYTTKVDMYALGVTFLEMCCPVSTTQGRYSMLNGARRQERELPSKLFTKGWETQRKLIRSLLSHKQDERESATDIIASGVVPQPVGREQVHQYVMNLLQSNPEAYSELVEHFFNAQSTLAQDMAWDTNANAIDQPREAASSSIVNQKLHAVFQRHGAVESNRQGIFPVSSLYLRPATFLDRSGATLQLPYDLTLPFARLLLREKVRDKRHYTFGVVYRPGAIGGQPQPRAEVSFDVVSYSAKDLSLKDAEVLKVLDEVLAEFASLRKSRSIVIFLNHSDLLEMIIKSCGFESGQSESLKKLLSLLNTTSSAWRRIETELRSPQHNIPKSSIQQLALFNFQDDLQGGRKKLERLFTSAQDRAKLQQVFARLLEVQKYASKLKVETTILLNPLVNYSESLYRGSIMFQCVDAVQKRILAVGGRFDQLINSFSADAFPHGATRAVGLRLNSAELAERLATDLKTMSKTSRATQKQQRCDVLVTSFDEQTLTTTGLEVIADLWRNDFRAELTEYYGTLEEVAAAYKNEGQCIVVIVREDVNAVGGVGVRVRTLGKQDEEEVKSTELVGWLRAELKEKDVLEVEHPRTKLRRETSVGEPVPQMVPDGRPAEVIVIAPKHKGKKTNRQHLVDDAALVVKETARSYVVEAPILAIEATNEVLEALKDTRIESAESWKAFLQACPAEETRYLKEVQQTLLELALGGKKGAWVYSSKTRACIYCYL